jgi:hypothetical protein
VRHLLTTKTHGERLSVPLLDLSCSLVSLPGRILDTLCAWKGRRGGGGVRTVRERDGRKEVIGEIFCSAPHKLLKMHYPLYLQ